MSAKSEEDNRHSVPIRNLPDLEQVRISLRSLEEIIRTKVSAYEEQFGIEVSYIEIHRHKKAVEVSIHAKILNDF
jgi:hypothetical protein